MSATAALSFEPQPSSAGARLVADLLEVAHYYESRGFTGGAFTLAELRFAVALARYRFTPPQGQLIAQRTHILVFGGAAAGKSTVTNILVGSAVADVNAQAGYTRHPTAYTVVEPTGAQGLWPTRLGPLLRRDSTQPGDVDADIFGWTAVQPVPDDREFLSQFVVWDAPDLTTKDSSYYQFRVIEIAALAHVGVYVASDERYNDELPTNFLQGLLAAGKPVIVILTKVSPLDAEELIGLFRAQVASRLRNSDRIVAIVAVPSPPGKIAALWTDQFPHTKSIRAAIESAAPDLQTANREAVLAAVRYFQELENRLLDPLHRDLGEWKTWTELVRQAANDAVLRFEREYLSRVQYQELNDELDRLLKVFELEGPLHQLWQFFEVLRTPFRWLKGLWKRFMPRVTAEPVNEDEALDSVCEDMLESLRVACATKRARHRLWAELRESLTADALSLIGPAFAETRERQRREIRNRLNATTKSMETWLASRPMLCRTMQVSRLALDIALLGVAAYYAGFTLLLFVFPVIAAGAVEELVRLGCRWYVNRDREVLQRQQRDNVRELVQTVYINNLLRLPPGTGPQLHSLAELAHRLPKDLAAVAAALP